MLRVELLGGVVVRREAEVLGRFSGQKYGALLARLAMRPGRPLSREVLIEMLWPEVEPAVGRNRLSVALSVLRRILE